MGRYSLIEAVCMVPLQQGEWKGCTEPLPLNVKNHMCVKLEEGNQQDMEYRKDRENHGQKRVL